MTDMEAVAKAKEQLSQAEYHSEMSANRGVAVMYGNKAEWLRRVIRLAEAAQREEGQDG